MGSSRRMFAVVAVIAVAVVVAGCGSSSKKKTTASVSTKPAATSTTTAPSAPAANESWSLPNANLSQTRDVAGPINSSTVSKLGVAWTVPISALGAYGTYFTTPVVVNGVVYTQDAESNVYAINFQTGKVMWTKKYNSPDTGPNGVTVSEGMVFGATETSAFALSASTGEQLWEKKLVRNKNEGVDMAPGINNGVVYVSTVPGNSKGFYEGEGKAILWAMDAKTGATKWKWDEVGNLWGDEKINSGGGQWEPPTFGPEGNLYLGVANPAPYGEETPPANVPGENIKDERYGSTRPGPDLYTDSVVKLNAETGKLMWYYQLTPHDIQDHDINNAPELTKIDGKEALIAAGKGGIAIALDAETGKLLWKTPVGKHNGHDNDNLIAMRKEYSKLPKASESYTILPGEEGGVESQFATNGTTDFFPISNFAVNYNVPTQPPYTTGTGEMVAVEQATGKIKWTQKFPHSSYGGATVVNDLVFTTTYEGTLWALNAETGEVVWKSKLPAGTNAPLAVVGSTLITAGSYPMGAGQKPEIVAYRLGAGGA